MFGIGKRLKTSTMYITQNIEKIRNIVAFARPKMWAFIRAYILTYQIHTARSWMPAGWKCQVGRWRQRMREKKAENFSDNAGKTQVIVKKYILQQLRQKCPMAQRGGRKKSQLGIKNKQWSQLRSKFIIPYTGFNENYNVDSGNFRKISFRAGHLYRLNNNMDRFS